MAAKSLSKIPGSLWAIIIFSVLLYAGVTYYRSRNEMFVATVVLENAIRELKKPENPYSALFNEDEQILMEAGLQRDSIYNCMSRVGGDPKLALE
jgi:hypothetical protein